MSRNWDRFPADVAHKVSDSAPARLSQGSLMVNYVVLDPDANLL